MKESKAKALAVCGTVLTLASTFFHLLGFSTPHWLESFESAKSRFDRIGLWTACFHNFGYDRDQLGKLYDGCHWIYSYEYKPIFDWLNPPWLLSVQVIMSLVLIINIVTSLLLVLGRFGKGFVYTEAPSQFIASMGMFISGLMMAFCVTIFGIQSDVDRQWFPRPDQNYLSWSFGLVIVAGFFAFFAAMCLLVDSLRIKWENEKKKRTGYPYMEHKMQQVPPQYA